MRFVSLPVQVAMYLQSGPGALTWIGTAVFAVGFFFETVGDWQLTRFRADPASRGKVMDRGLWRYTRHPNYFGDACVWWGLYLIAAQQWQGALTILSTVLMTTPSRMAPANPCWRRGWPNAARVTPSTCAGRADSSPGARGRLGHRDHQCQGSATADGS